ncbi:MULTISPECIES: hypothetical protein [Brevibacterium]|nr:MULTISPECIES: hypothetical protein [Brevibacterium]
MRYAVALLIGIGAMFGVNQLTGIFSLPRPWNSLLMGATVGLTMVVILLVWETVRPSRHGQSPKSAQRTGDRVAGGDAADPAEEEVPGDEAKEAEVSGDMSDPAEDEVNRPEADSESEKLALISGDHMADEPGVGEADGSSLENPPPGEARTLGEPGEPVIADPGKEVEAPDEVEIPEAADDADPEPVADESEGDERGDPTDIDAYGGRSDPDPHSDTGVTQEPGRRD